MATALNTAAGVSAASEAFRKCSADLIRGIQDPELLAWELYSDDVVSETVVDEVSVVGLSGVQRKTRLLSAVRDQIAIDPAKFQNLLLALRKQPPLKDVADKLETIYNNCAVPQPQESAHAYDVGFPVELLREAWYHTGITRETAEERLEHGASGCFLVRESETKPGCFSLSLTHPGGIAHFPIVRKDSGLYELTGTHKGFTTLPNLIDHFKHHPISEDPHRQLSYPCYRVTHVVEDTPPSVATQTTLPPVPLPRRRLNAGKHTANTSFKGKGSPNYPQQFSDTILPHTPDSKTHPLSELTWRRLPDMPDAMVCPQSVTVDTAVYITDRGSSRKIHRYDPQTQQWTGPLRYQYCNFSMTEVNQQLVLVGGVDSSTVPGKTTNSVAVYSPSQRSWKEPYPPMNTPRQYPAVSTYHQHIVVAGGSDARKISTDMVEILDISACPNQWFSATSLPMRCRQMSAAIIHNTLYLLGGDGLGKQVVSVSLPALTQTGEPPAQWCTLPDAPLEYSTAIAIGESLLAVGGSDGQQRSSAIHVFNQEKNAWKKVGDLPTERSYCACCLLPREILFAGGKDYNGWTSRIDVATVL